MNTNQTCSAVRTVLKIVGGIAVANGWLPESHLDEVIGALALIIGLVWSHFDHADGPNVTPGPGTVASVLMAALLCAGCSSLVSTTERTNADGSKEFTKAKIKTFFDAKSDLAKFENSAGTPGTNKTARDMGTKIGKIAQESSGSNAVQVVKIVVETAAAAAPAAFGMPPVGLIQKKE